MADNIQTNVYEGDFVAVANADLRSKEGFLVKLVDATGNAKIGLSAAETDVTIGVLLEGGNTGENVTVRPLVPGRQVRVIVATTIAGGVKITSDANGKAAALGAAGAGKAAIGVTMEDCASGDYCRILPLQFANQV